MIVMIENCLKNNKLDTTNWILDACYFSKVLNRAFQFNKSEKYLLSALKLSVKKNDSYLKGVVYNHLAYAYTIQSEKALALKSYLRAMGYYKQSKNQGAIVAVNVDLAEFNRGIGNYPDARKFLMRAFNLYSQFELDSLPLLIRLHNRHSAIENEHGNGDSSIYHSIKAIKLSRIIGDKYAEAQSLNELGFSYKNLKQVDTSYNCYSKAIELWEDVGAQTEAVHAKFNRVRLLAHNDVPQIKVIPLYHKVIDEVKNKRIHYWLDELYFELGNSYLFIGDSINYLKCRVAFFEENSRKSELEQRLKIDDIKEKYENDKIRSEILQMTSNLHKAERIITEKKKENLIIYIVLSLFITMVVVITFLAISLYKSNKQLNEKNKEKDILIQEIHHRVKNNLQFVSSLINLQINSSHSNAEKDSLNDASRRIKSMALVHEMLYNYQETNGIEIRAYLTELLSSLSELVNSKKTNINFNIDCEFSTFNVTSAIALGMITSELVSNSIKHAFSNVSKPQITLELKKKESGFTLSVKDNGIGIKDINNRNSDTMGLRLIDIFSRQIKGSYEFRNENGLVFELVFNYK